MKQKNGFFPKEVRHSNPQIILGLIVSLGGFDEDFLCHDDEVRKNIFFVKKSVILSFSDVTH